MTYPGVLVELIKNNDFILLPGVNPNKFKRPVMHAPIQNMKIHLQTIFFCILLISDFIAHTAFSQKINEKL